MKNGLIYENGELIYYKNDRPKHAGVIKEKGDIYYIGSKGRAVKGSHVVHQEMANGLLKHGTYMFGDDYKLIKGSYVPPRKKRVHKTVKKSGSKRRGWKLGKKKLLPVILLVGLFVVLLVVAMLIEGKMSPKIAPVAGDANGGAAAQNHVSLPSFDGEVLLCSQEAKQAYDGEITVKQAIASGDPYRPFVFRYNLWNKSGVLLISEDPRMKNAQWFALDKDDTVLQIDNLKTGTQYYYTVIVEDKEYDGSFVTAQSTRFVTIPGVKNTRDIGGFTTLDGKTVKQELLIRGTEMDGLVVPYYLMQMSAQTDVQNTFGFVYDMDLRETSLDSGAYRSPLGEQVGHKFYQSPQYGQIFNANWKPALKQIFSDLADPAKYPMYLHCSWGQDRTGTIAFLLQGVLNMSLEDMLYDYRASGYNNAVMADAEQMDAVIFGLEPYDGNTTQEKIVDYLKTFVGVTEEEINSIRSIFLSE